MVKERRFTLSNSCKRSRTKPKRSLNSTQINHDNHDLRRLKIMSNHDKSWQIMKICVLFNIKGIYSRHISAPLNMTERSWRACGFHTGKMTRQIGRVDSTRVKWHVKSGVWIPHGQIDTSNRACGFHTGKLTRQIGRFAGISNNHLFY